MMIKILLSKKQIVKREEKMQNIFQKKLNYISSMSNMCADMFWGPPVHGEIAASRKHTQV